MELNEDDSKMYKIGAICDVEIHAKELDNGYHLPTLYYLIS